MKKITRYLGGLTAGMLMASAALAQETAAPAAAPAAPAVEAAPAPAPADAPAATAADNKDVYAIVDGRKLTNTEIDAQCDGQIEGAKQRGIPPDQIAGFRAYIRPKIADQLIMREAVLAYADKKGLKASEEDVKAQIAETAKEVGGEEQLNSLLDAQHITRSQLEKEAATMVLFKKIVETVPPPGEADVAKYFETNKARYAEPEQVHASHILLGTEGDTPELKAEKFKKIQELRARLEKGEDFATLARENSTCPSAPDGGDLGKFGRGDMVEQFDKVAFEIEPGKVSDVVETKFGYHLIKVAEHDQAKEANLTAVHDKIVEEMRGPKVEELIAQIRKDSKVEYPNGNPQPPAPMMPVMPAPPAVESN